jgi:hypothetical protein
MIRVDETMDLTDDFHLSKWVETQARLTLKAIIDSGGKDWMPESDLIDSLRRKLRELGREYDAELIKTCLHPLVYGRKLRRKYHSVIGQTCYWFRFTSIDERARWSHNLPAPQPEPPPPPPTPLGAPTRYPSWLSVSNGWIYTICDDGTIWRASEAEPDAWHPLPGVPQP